MFVLKYATIAGFKETFETLPRHWSLVVRFAGLCSCGGMFCSRKSSDNPLGHHCFCNLQKSGSVCTKDVITLPPIFHRSLCGRPFSPMVAGWGKWMDNQRVGDEQGKDGNARQASTSENRIPQIVFRIAVIRGRTYLWMDCMICSS